MLPFSAVLGWADIALSTVPVEGPDESLTYRAKSVALLFGQDNFSGWNISEESDRRLLPASLPVFIQRMVVIIHLVVQHGE